MPLVAAWFQAFVWTLVLELPFALLLRGLPSSRRFGLIVFANLLTHPAVWFVFPELGSTLHWGAVATLMVSEVWAYLIEMAFYVFVLGREQTPTAIKLSIAANSASLALGILLQELGY